MRVTLDQFEDIPAAPTYDAPAYNPAPMPYRQDDGLGHYTMDDGVSWYNNDGSLYSASQSYAQPQDDYFGNFDAYAPENMGTQTYDLPQQPSQADWYNFDNSAGMNNAPFQDPGYESPNNPYWMQEQDNTPWWQKAGNAIGDSFVDTAQTFGNVIAAPYVAAESAFSDKTGTGFNERVGANFSGEKAQDMLGIDTSYMDWLREQGILGKTAAYGIDTLTAPATILTAGLGPEAGAIGSAFTGGFGKRLAGETALGVAGYLGSDAANSDVADRIPYFSDQPDWLRSLEGGAIGGIGAYGGLKAAGKGLENAGGFKGVLAGESGETPPLFPKGQGDKSIPELQADLRAALAAEEPYKQRMKDLFNSPVSAARSDAIDIARVELEDVQHQTRLADMALKRAMLETPSPSTIVPPTPKVPDTVGPTGYFKGDQILYTGGPDKDGFYTFEYLEGSKKGQQGVTTTRPDGTNPSGERFQAEWKAQQEQFRKLRGVSDQMPGSPPPRTPSLPTDTALNPPGRPLDTASLFENRAGITGRGIPEGTGRLASGPVPPQTNLFGDVAQQPVFRGDETPAVMQARKIALDTLAGNREIRRSGVTASEVSAGRRAQAGGILEGYEKGLASGLSGGDLLDSAVDNIPTGRIIKTNAGEITATDRNALKDVVAQWMSEDPNTRLFEARTARDVLDAMATPGGYMPQPHEDALLRKILGDELTDTVSSRLKGAGVEGAKVELPTRPLDLGEQTRAVQPPIEALPSGKFVTEEQRAQNFVDALDARKKAADDYIKGFAGREQNPSALDLGLGQGGQQLHLADAKLPEGIYKSGTPSPKPRTMTPARIMQMGRQAFGEAFALPRALKSSLDLSAPLRQGAMLSWRHPKAAAEAFADQMRAWRSPEAAKRIDDLLNARPNARVHKEAGLYRAAYDEAAQLSEREEAFLSKVAAKLPGVRASNRAYATYLNKIRADSFDSVWNSLPELEKTSDTATALARFINVASGRGELPGFLDGAGPLLGQILYSPRYVTSRPQALWMAVSGNGSAIARKEALKTLGAYFGGTSTILALGNAGGLWDVELDPRSADFGKGRIGPLRYDFWTGYSQLARLGAQVATGQRKSTATGDIYELDSRMEPVARFTRSKLNPTTGEGVNILTGSDYKGDKLGGPLSRLLELVVPIQPAEMVRAYEDYGWEMALATLPGFLGAGTGVYSPSDYEKRDKQSMEKFGIPYSKQTPEQRLEFTDAYGKIPSANPQVKLAVEKATTSQQGADEKLADQGLTYANGKEWRDAYGDNKDNLRFLKDVVYADAGTKPGKDPILDAYYEQIEASVKYGKPDWDKLDAYVKNLDPKDQKYIKDHTGFLQIDTPTTRAFEKAKDTIENSGYFDRQDETWKQVADILGLKEPDYYAWRDAKAEEFRQILGSSKNDPLAEAEIQKQIDKQEAAKGMEKLSKQWKEQWVLENPAAAYQAWLWGYYLPTDPIKKYLQAEVGSASGR